MTQKVVTGSIDYLMRQYKHEFRSRNWKVIRIKDWSDGKRTYLFEYTGND